VIYGVFSLINERASEAPSMTGMKSFLKCQDVNADRSRQAGLFPAAIDQGDAFSISPNYWT
jgi:hypothetical protein